MKLSMRLTNTFNRYAYSLFFLQSFSISLCFFTFSTYFVTYYFLQIMDSTKTHVAWPSRLKIGAKTKKGSYFLLLPT